MIVVETGLKAFLAANARPYDENALKSKIFKYFQRKYDIELLFLPTPKNSGLTRTACEFE
jgi:hypothetical protein